MPRIFLRIFIFIGLFFVTSSFGAIFKVSDASIAEGDAGRTYLNFTIELYATPSSPCDRRTRYRVYYKTYDGTATTGNNDYEYKYGYFSYRNNWVTIRPVSGTQTCATQNVSVIINGDTDLETDETFTLNLYNSYHASIDNGTATGTIINDDQAPASSFSLRYKANLMGNMKVIGNTVLKDDNWFWHNQQQESNSEVDLRYITNNIPAGTFNASTATLTDNAITSDGVAKIKWAGLYWSGYLHTYDGSDVSYSTQYTGLTDKTTINNVINNHTVIFTVNGTSSNIRGQVLGTNLYMDTWNYDGINYACFADVTALLQDQDPRATYTVANVPSMEGRTQSGTRDGLGNSGAWSLVIVYENKSPSEKTRNVTVFDGYESLGVVRNVKIPLEGFLTPTSGEVDSTLSIFANEGDRYITGDYLSIINQDNNTFKVDAVSGTPNSDGYTNYFASYVTGVPSRNPTYLNNNGIDIQTSNIGSANNGIGAISNNQNKATIEIGTNGDYFYPILAAFATELYRPDICYDFAGLVGDNIIVPVGDDRTFSVTEWASGDPFYLKAFIRSEESDFALVNTSLKVALSDLDDNSLPTSKLSFSLAKTEVSPNSINGYLPAIGIASDASGTFFSIGEDNSPTGGIISANENTYAKAAFNFGTSSIIEGKFDLILNTYLQLDPNNPTDLTPYTYSTKEGTLQMCGRNYVYDPVPLYFNIERQGSDTYTAPYDKYPLYTQVVGKPFNIDIVSYTGAPSYTTEVGINNVTVDLELFNAGSYENNSTVGYDSTCSEPSNAVTDGLFRTFTGDSRIHVDDFVSDVALANAAFRVWVLTTSNDEPIHHSCTDPSDDACFKTVYEDNYFDANSSDNICQDECLYAPNGQCYSCLKKYYAKPICSRDNFSVRPDGFKVRIYDDNESNESTTPEEIISNGGNNQGVLASGYNYLLGLQALAFPQSGETLAFGYYNENFKIESLQNAPDRDAIVLQFNDNNTSCNDTNSTTYRYIFHNGAIESLKGTNKLFAFDNVGNYQFWIDDTDWTKVDQKDYPYKTTFGGTVKSDCVEGSASSSPPNMVGCSTRSIVSDNSNFNNINLQFNPYGFNLDSVNMQNSPNASNTSWLYTNNLDENSSMGVKFDGNVTAVAKNGDDPTNYTPTSNFVVGCAATNVDLDLNITSTPTAGSIQAFSLNDGSTTNIGLNNTLMGVVDSNGTQATIPGANFIKDNNGSATIDLRYNYDRENDKVTNPILATFNSLTASAPNASARAHMDNNRTPDGNRTYNASRTFLKARVYPKNEDKVIEVTGASDTTSLAVLAYCDNNSLVSCNSVLNDAPENSPQLNWYYMTTHDAGTEGLIISLASLQAGTNISPSNNIQFVNNGSTNGITIGYAGARSQVVQIDVTPDEWLKYHIDAGRDGLPFFRYNFLTAPGWVGEGDTGNVVGTPVAPTTDSGDRVSW